MATHNKKWGRSEEQVSVSPIFPWGKLGEIRASLAVSQRTYLPQLCRQLTRPNRNWSKVTAEGGGTAQGKTTYNIWDLVQISPHPIKPQKCSLGKAVPLPDALTHSKEKDKYNMGICLPSILVLKVTQTTSFNKVNCMEHLADVWSYSFLFITPEHCEVKLQMGNLHCHL